MEVDMARVTKNIEVDVPVRTAYNQWTQFEEFPKFMEGVERVDQLDNRRLRWKAKVGPKSEEWDAEIREQVPDEKVIWTATSGAENAGMVTFDPLGPSKTRVHLEMSYDPEGFVEKVGDALGFMNRRVEGDLQRFKEYIEARGIETGAWRGEIENPDAPSGHTRGAGAPGRSGQQANLEGKDPSSSRGGEVLDDTSVGMRTPGASEPGSLSRDPDERARAGYTDRSGVEYPES
jgi:uncharacterized membrane protein